MSTICIPALTESHKENGSSGEKLAKQWRALFERGKAQNPPIAVAAASSFLYLAWQFRQGSALYKKTVYSRSGLCLAAAAFTLGIVPYTLIRMSGTNNALLQRAQSKEASSQEVSDLTERWARLNFVRGLLPFAGAACGLVAVFL